MNSHSASSSFKSEYLSHCHTRTHVGEDRPGSEHADYMENHWSQVLTVPSPLAYTVPLVTAINLSSLPELPGLENKTARSSDQASGADEISGARQASWRSRKATDY